MTDMNIGCFISLTATRSLAGTAALLNVSKTSILQNIKRLEEDLGVALFITTSPEVRLTEAGRKFVSFFNKVGTEIGGAQSHLAHEKNGVTLSVGWSEYVGRPDWVKHAMSQFKTANPDINLLSYQASPPNLLTLLSSGKIDIALSSRYLTRGLRDAFRTVPLEEMPLYLIMVNDSIYIDMSVREILTFDVPFLASYAWETEEAGVVDRIDYECIRIGCRPRQTRVLPNLDSVYISVRLGNGIAVCPLNEKLRAADKFEYLELSRTITVCMTTLLSNTSSAAAHFESFLKGCALDREGAVL